MTPEEATEIDAVPVIVNGRCTDCGRIPDYLTKLSQANVNVNEREQANPPCSSCIDLQEGE